MAEEVGKIYERMAQANSEIDAVQKTEQGQGLPYKFRSIYGIYKMVHPILERNKIFIVPNTLNVQRTVNENEKNDYKGGTKRQIETLTIVKVKYEFTTDDGSHIDAITYGEGLDYSDKSLNKAYTSAMKNALLQVFTIPADAMDENSADDNDSEYENPALSKGKQTQTGKSAPPQSDKDNGKADDDNNSGENDKQKDDKYKTTDDYITRINGGKLAKDDKPIDTLEALRGWQKKHQPKINKMPTDVKMSIMAVFQERHDVLKKSESIPQDDPDLAGLGEKEHKDPTA